MPKACDNNQRVFFNRRIDSAHGRPKSRDSGYDFGWGHALPPPRSLPVALVNKRAQSTRESCVQTPI